MASLIARLGPCEAQRATLFTRHHDKRWRIGRVCHEQCSRSQRRLYSTTFDLHPLVGSEPRVADKPHPLQRLAAYNATRRQSPSVATAHSDQNAPAVDKSVKGEWSDEGSDGMQALLESVDDGSVDEVNFFGEPTFSWSVDAIPQWTWRVPGKILDACKKVRYTGRFQKALDQGKESVSVKCWLAAAQNHDHEFIKAVSDQSFEQLLALMDPKASRFAKFEQVHKEMFPRSVQLTHLRPMHHIAGEFANVLHYIWSTRRQHSTLTVKQYAMFLRMARRLGHKILADTLFHALYEDGMTPDRECWNEYMGALVHNRAHRAWSRHLVRTTAYNMERRHSAKGLFKNYAVGPNGIKQSVTKIFQKMLREGISPNEQTFCLFIIAAAREGDMDTVKGVLKKIWGVDVQAMAAGKSEKELETKKIPRQSPVYPSPELVTAIAHAFAINSDMPTALQIIDFMARRFNVSIPREAWEELFERILPLVRSRSGAQSKINGSKTGLVDPKIVRRLFDMATGHPYYMEPTMRMYDVLLRSFSGVRADNAFGHVASSAYLPGMEYVIVKGVFLYRKSLLRFHRLRNTLKGNKGRHYDDFLAKYEEANLQSKRDHHYLRYWMRRLLSVTPDAQRDRPMKVESLCFRRIPQLLYLCEPWAPSKVWYEVPGGQIEFNLRNEDDLLRSQMLATNHAYERRKRSMRSLRVVGRNWSYAPGTIAETRRVKQFKARETALPPLPYEEFAVGQPPSDIV